MCNSTDQKRNRFKKYNQIKKNTIRYNFYTPYWQR